MLTDIAISLKREALTNIGRVILMKKIMMFHFIKSMDFFPKGKFF